MSLPRRTLVVEPALPIRHGGQATDDPAKAEMSQPITKTCAPRPDVLSGSLADDHFAADLDKIVRDPDSYAVYGDPDQFFALTHPTKGLKDMLARTFGRLAGVNVPGAQHGVLRPQTVFGGGKTHGLIALYHLANGARPSNLASFVDTALLPDGCQMAAAVGDKYDPEDGIETRLGRVGAPVRVRTMWGDIAAQLGDEAWEVMKSKDESRTAPGSDSWERAIGNAPTIIIIDEIAQHIRQCATSGDADVRRMAEAIPVFLKALMQVAAAKTNVVVIVSLATDRDAYGEETTELEMLLNEQVQVAQRSAEDTKSVLARHQTIIRPAEDSEIADILKTRLFASIDAAAAQETAAEYQELYEQVDAAGVNLPDGADQPVVYAERLASSYPFHPELVRVLDNRIGTIPNFQRARGALRLLAEVIAAVWKRDADLPILNVADVDLSAGNVLSSLTAGLGRDAYEQVAKVDIAGPTSHAAEIDSDRFAGKKPYATRTATTVFMHSLEQVSSAGASRGDWLLGTLEPGDSAEVVDEALNVLSTSAWHLIPDVGRYAFRTEANANAVIAEEARTVSNVQVTDEMDERIQKAFKTDGPITVRFAPSGPSEVPDHQTLQLVVLHYEDNPVVGTATSPSNRIIDIRSKAGAAEGHRANKNGVCFLVADKDHVASLRDRIRKHMAITRILASDTRRAALGKAVIDRIEATKGDAVLEVRVAISRCYSHIYYPVRDSRNSDLRHYELPARDKGQVQERQTSVILDVLRNEAKIRTTPLAYDYLQSKTWPKDHTTSPPRFKAEIRVTDLEAPFWQDPSLPIITDLTLIKEAVRAGVTAGKWVYYDADQEKAWCHDDPPPPVQLVDSVYLFLPEKAAEKGLCRQELTGTDVEQAVAAKGTLTATDLRAGLEAKLGYEPAKKTVLETLARVASGPGSSIVVVEGTVEAGAKPATKSAIEKARFNNVTILTRAAADAAGVVLDGSTRTGPVIVRATGVAGPAFAQAAQKASEVADAKGIKSVTVKATADPGEKMRDIRSLGSALGMVPKFGAIVRVDVNLDFAGFESETIIDLSGDKAAYQRIEDKMLAFGDLCEEADGHIAITLTHATGLIQPDGPEWTQLRTAVSNVDPGAIELTAEVIR